MTTTEKPRDELAVIAEAMNSPILSISVDAQISPRGEITMTINRGTPTEHAFGSKTLLNSIFLGVLIEEARRLQEQRKAELIPANQWIDSCCPGAIPWARSS